MHAAGGTAVSAPLAEDKGLGEDHRAVISHITKKSPMIIANSPNNPTGTVFSKADLSGLAKIGVECDLLVISNEMYEKNHIRRCSASLLD